MADTGDLQAHKYPLSIPKLAEPSVHRDRALQLDAACNFLSRNHPVESARFGLSASQRAGFSALAGAGLCFLLIASEALFLAIMVSLSLLFCINISLRIAAVTHALIMSLRSRKTPHTPAQITASTLPRFSLLIPLYHEANVAAQSVQAMAALDYPTDKIEIIYLLEADDEQTFAALQACRSCLDFNIVTVPACAPRTKPKALNYGLALANGDIITVFDAEDIPHPQQLKVAAAAFQNGEPNLAVVQAELRPHNGAANWISAQFTLEYAIQFCIWMPLISSLRWPLSLGGTSNHFRADILRLVGAWDPYNVTEDADLGLRLAAHGFGAKMIASYTLEEAPVQLGQWLSQRSRWIKGHLTTWLVHMRHPVYLFRRLGVNGFLGLHFTTALALLATYLHAPLIIWTLLQLGRDLDVSHILYFTLMVLGYASAALAALATPAGRQRWGAIFTMPLYWPLLSIAAARALWEMHARPHLWAKTPHGLSPPPTRD